MRLQTKSVCVHWGDDWCGGENEYYNRRFIQCVTKTDHVWFSSAKQNVNSVLETNQKRSSHAGRNPSGTYGGHNKKEADCPIRFSYRLNNTEVHQRVTNIQTINTKDTWQNKAALYKIFKPMGNAITVTLRANCNMFFFCRPILTDCVHPCTAGVWV